MHYLLFYDVVPDYLERRAKFRKEHLDLCWEACGRGELILGGALADRSMVRCCCFKVTRLRSRRSLRPQTLLSEMDS